MPSPSWRPASAPHWSAPCSSGCRRSGTTRAHRPALGPRVERQQGGAERAPFGGERARAVVLLDEAGVGQLAEALAQARRRQPVAARLQLVEADRPVAQLPQD